MPNSMYQIHVIQVAGESPIASSQIALFFEDKAFLTYDLPAMLPESAGYSRRCIDRCDFVVMVVGCNYGETNASGVSQLHLSYLVAKTKSKPILTFIRKTDERTSRRIVDFIRILQQDSTKNLHYYQHEAVLGQHLENVYKDFVHSLPINRLSVNNTKDITEFTSAIKATTSSKYAKIDADKSTSLTKSPSLAKSTSSTQKAAVNTDVKLASSNVQPPYVDKTDLLLVDELSIYYQAHAYQDGNLSDVYLSNRFQWVDVVKALVKLNGVFSTDSIYRSLNELVSGYASEAAKKTMPNVHAVSRCQVNQKDFEWICNQLIHNNWIEAVVNSKGREANGQALANKKLWQLTGVVKNELEFLQDVY